MGKKKTRRLAKEMTYSRYIHKVFKTVCPNMSISSKAMKIMDSLILDTFERIASEAGQLTRRNNRCTLQSTDIMIAVRLVLNGELAKHAISNGFNAIHRPHADCY